VLIDGIPAEDVGGTFDFGTVSSTGIGAVGSSSTAIEVYRGPDSVMYGSDASASVISLATPRGTGMKPVLNYSGDAGNFHTYRNEAVLSGAHKKVDYYAAFSRFQSGNALPLDEYHSVTSAANVGYAIAANTLARLTIRNADSAEGAPGAWDFQGESAAAKQSDQDIYSGLALENRLENGWHNLVRYDIARKREQFDTFYAAGTCLNDGNGGDYYGKPVTIRGANGYTATGQTILEYTYGCPVYPGTYPQLEDPLNSDRDELYYQTDYVFPYRIAALFGFRYENERGSFNYPAYDYGGKTQRTNFEYTLQFSGNIKNRLFYSAGGALEKNHLYGIAGTPRIGLAYQPVYPSDKWMHGTRIRVNVAAGVVEPSLSAGLSSLFDQLQQADDSADIAKFHIGSIGPERSRTLDFGVDQDVRGEKLIFKAGYFHNQFSHQIESVGASALKRYFGIIPLGDPNLYSAYLNSLAFRGEGAESEIQYRPFARLFIHGGYTYLDSVVEQSFSSDAVAALQGMANTNPNIPGIAIGAYDPLVGARPFRRPPHSGFFAIQYAGSKFSAALKGAMASRSDDSTYLFYTDLAGTDSMILPNRDLAFGYAKLDANATYAVKKGVTVFTELDNLLSQQHIGPIGYPALPFTVRAGLKVRIGGD
jgi:iron complex outermembrane receptor protein/vitamin B12 transporter